MILVAIKNLLRNSTENSKWMTTSRFEQLKGFEYVIPQNRLNLEIKLNDWPKWNVFSIKKIQ